MKRFRCREDVDFLRGTDVNHIEGATRLNGPPHHFGIGIPLRAKRLD
jgi:hypothetical protein